MKFRKTEPWITSCLICGNVAMAYNRIPEWAKKDLAQHLTPPAEAFRAEPVGFTREELCHVMALVLTDKIESVQAEDSSRADFDEALAEKARALAKKMK